MNQLNSLDFKKGFDEGFETGKRSLSFHQDTQLLEAADYAYECEPSPYRLGYIEGLNEGLESRFQ